MDILLIRKYLDLTRKCLNIIKIWIIINHHTKVKDLIVMSKTLREGHLMMIEMSKHLLVVRSIKILNWLETRLIWVLHLREQVMQSNYGYRNSKCKLFNSNNKIIYLCNNLIYNTKHLLLIKAKLDKIVKTSLTIIFKMLNSNNNEYQLMEINQIRELMLWINLCKEAMNISVWMPHHLLSEVEILLRIINSLIWTVLEILVCWLLVTLICFLKAL